MRFSFHWALVIVLFLACGPAIAQKENASGDFSLQPLQDRSTYRQSTDAGDYTIGTRGTQKHEREGSHTGDLEVGRIFTFRTDPIVPHVIEVEPFLVNRFGSYEESLYETLGVGVGTQVALRKADEDDRWFARFAAIEPTDFYRERYTAGEGRTIFELTFGRSYFLSPPPRTTMLENRLARFHLRATIPPAAVTDVGWAQAHGYALIHEYLQSHYLQMRSHNRLRYGPMSDIRFIVRRSGVTLSDTEAELLTFDQHPGVLDDTWQDVFEGMLRRALTLMLREQCRVVFHVAGSQSLQAFAAAPDGRMSGDGPLDVDALIDAYVTTRWQWFKAGMAYRR